MKKINLYYFSILMLLPVSTCANLTKIAEDIKTAEKDVEEIVKMTQMTIQAAIAHYSRLYKLTAGLSEVIMKDIKDGNGTGKKN